MLGPIITFLAVCAILAIYMSIVHHFLRASEQREDRRPEEPHGEPEPAAKPSFARRWRKRWAH